MLGSIRSQLTRRTMLASGAAMAASPALAQECRIGPPPHDKGPVVWNDMDQVELDAAYDQVFYAPLLRQIGQRRVANSEAARARIGQPVRMAYGPTEVEKLDIYRAKRAKAPIFVFIHGGAWLGGDAKNYGDSAELFVNAGAHYVVLDFIAIKPAGGDLRVMADQVRRAIAWTYRNAASFDGDPDRFYIGGHSSGGHLCGVALVTDWQKDFGLPAGFHQGRAVHERHVRHEGRAALQAQLLREVQRRDGAGDELAAASRPPARARRRHLRDRRDARIPAPEPRLRRAVVPRGKPAQDRGAGYNHFEMAESLGNPYGPNGRAALAMMKLA